MKKNGEKFSRIMTCGVLALTLLIQQPSYAQKSSTESVELSKAEADSLLSTLDSYETRLRLARINLAECREYAQLDSLIFAQYKESTKRGFLDKLVNHPIIWFVLGTYIGVMAADASRR